MKYTRSGIAYRLTMLVGIAALFLVLVVHSPCHYVEHSEDSESPQHECPICALLHHSNFLLVSHFEAPVPIETWAIFPLQHSTAKQQLALALIHNRAPPIQIPA